MLQYEKECQGEYYMLKVWKKERKRFTCTWKEERMQKRKDANACVILSVGGITRDVMVRYVK